MNHLDLFSGIGGFSLGLKKVFNIKHTYYSEIDKYAIDVYKQNFKNSTYVKSIIDVRARELPRIDVITFGSPCQDFSLAGKRKGMDGERSSLITEAIRLIKECRPRFFIWENVKGTFSSNSGSDFWAIIQAFTNIGGYRLEWQLLNTKWFLPQNRQRIYLVGYIGNGSGRQVFPITESGRKINNIQRQQADTCTLTTRYEAGGNGSYIIERELNAQKTELKQIGTIGKDSEATRVYNTNCAKTIKDGGGMGVKTGLYMIKTNNKKGFEIAEPGDTINYQNLPSKTRRGRVGKGIAQTLDSGGEQAVVNSKIIRRLTPIECERLQGFPDDWTKTGKELGTISDSQRYKMCGNAVTVDVVKAVAEKIKKVI
jgi:DNA (cytosine-5)-methyltransferase 1